MLTLFLMDQLAFNSIQQFALCLANDTQMKEQ